MDFCRRLMFLRCTYFQLRTLIDMIKLTIVMCAYVTDRVFFPKHPKRNVRKSGKNSYDQRPGNEDLIFSKPIRQTPDLVSGVFVCAIAGRLTLP